MQGLSDGVRYYFAATAYDTEALESGYSNEVNGLPNGGQLYIGATSLRASRHQVEEQQTMAIERIGTYSGHLMNAGTTTYAWTVDIPSDCTCIVILGGGYDVYSGEPLISADLNGTQSFTVDQSLDAANDSNAFIGHLFSPSSTGSQTINFTLGAHGYETYVYLLFYKGTATTGLRDSDEASGTSVTLTTQSGDYVITAAAEQNDSAISWTNATEINEYHSAGGFYVAIAETVADGASESVSTSHQCAIAAIVLQPATGGGASAVPVVWGEEDPEGGTGESWSTWRTAAGDTPIVLGDSDWGKLDLTNLNHYGPVKDTGNSRGKRFVVKRDVYGEGLGAVTIYIRGSTDSFLASAGTPSWELYSGPVNRVWRYVQIKTEKA